MKLGDLVDFARSLLKVICPILQQVDCMFCKYICFVYFTVDNPDSFSLLVCYNGIRYKRKFLGAY